MLPPTSAVDDLGDGDQKDVEQFEGFVLVEGNRRTAYWVDRDELGVAYGELSPVGQIEPERPERRCLDQLSELVGDHTRAV